MKTPRISIATGLVLAVAFLTYGCDDSNTLPTTPQLGTASVLNSNTPFKTWQQGFNHGTTGWYGDDTPGALGWCGEIEQALRGENPVNPSAGRGYATVEQGGCNTHWSDAFGSGYRSAPYSPGPNFAAFSSEWPTGGFVVELDIYLDPTWTAGDLASGTSIFGPDGDFVDDNTTVFNYAVSLHELGTVANFIYFGVPVMPDSGKLSIFGHPVTQAGWYTFRHVFTSDNGTLAADFELADSRGATLVTKSYTETFFGVTVSGVTATDYGSGYLWFVSISPGLEVPIDEQLQRRGS